MFFKKIKSSFLKISQAQMQILFLLSSSLLLTSFFLISSMLSDTKIEAIAHSFAIEAEKNTNGGEYLSVLVESNDSQKNLRNPSGEFYATYGAFKETKICFAGTVNADKNYDIFIDELNEFGNISFLYANAFSNVEYKNHYKHEFYPIELMFPGNNSSVGVYSFCYISQTQADVLLDGRGLEHNDDNYQSLIGTSLNMSFNGANYLFNIGNIYLETNYFYLGLKEVMGNFVISSYRFPDDIECQYCYFLRNYDYQNKYFLNRINSLYDKDSFTIKINPYNTIKPIDDSRTNYLLSFRDAHGVQALNIIGICFLVLFISLFAFVVTFSLFFPFNRYRYFIFNVFILLIPYIFFKMLSFFTDSVLFFSSTATIINGIAILYIIVVQIIIYLNNKNGFIKW